MTGIAGISPIALAAGICLVFVPHQGAQARPDDELFPPLEGWTRPDAPKVFTAKTLYEFIDGAADVYLSYDFDRLTVGYYSRGDTTVTVEVYAFNSARDAYGIYSLERSPSLDFCPIGIQGYSAETVLNFVIGRTYVKCTGFQLGREEKRILTGIAEAMAMRLGGAVTPPPMLSCFPVRGIVRNSERFIEQNFLGYPFLHSAYIAEYRADSTAFQLFVIEAADTADSRTMWKRYTGQTAGPSLPSRPGMVTVSDPYQGVITLMLKGTVICGVIGRFPLGMAGEAFRNLDSCISHGSPRTGYDK